MNFCASLIELIGETHKLQIQTSVMAKRSTITQGRKSIIEHAIKNEYSHILFLDDDMAFTSEAFKSLRARDCSIISANAVTRPNIQKTALESLPLITAKDKNKKAIPSQNKTGIEPVSYIGLAFTLLRVEDIKKIPKPWFVLTEDVTEDYYFCKKAIESGLEIYVDHDATKHVAHVGDFPFSEKIIN